MKYEHRCCVEAFLLTYCMRLLTRMHDAQADLLTNDLQRNRDEKLDGPDVSMTVAGNFGPGGLKSRPRLSRPALSIPFSHLIQLSESRPFMQWKICCNYEKMPLSLSIYGRCNTGFQLQPSLALTLKTIFWLVLQQSFKY